MLIDHVIGGRYRITELIGQGGMGTVFEGVHTQTGSRVAIKLIVSKDIKEEVFVRFQREARAASTIDSHHIVRIFDMGTDEQSGSPYMVMERLYGEDLSQLMRRVGVLDPILALGLAAQAARGLNKAHEAGVVHRDIKPANLFIHDGGDTGEIIVKILDFGIAKVLMDTMQRSEENGLTRTGSMLGSPHYMSPEQAQGLRTIDHRSDVWSLGVVLYKMLAGQTPHANVESLGQTILAICSKPVRPVQDLAPWVPPEIAAIVHRALQPDPADRFQSAYAMYLAMEPLLVGIRPGLRRTDITPLSSDQRAHVAPVLANRAAGRRHDTPTGGTHHALTQDETIAPPPPRKKRGLVVFGVVAGLMAATGLAGIGLTFLSKKHAAAAGATAPTEPSTSTAALTPTAEAPPPPPPTLNERTVRVHITPATALVDIDGRKRDVVNGTVELSAPLGAVLQLHIVANGVDKVQPVAITEGGAIPPDIVLGTPTVASRPTTTPNNNGSGSSATTATTTKKPNNGTVGGRATPSATGTGVNVQRNFE